MARNMGFPEDLMFTREHLWVRIEDNEARLGVSDYLVDDLGRVMDTQMLAEGVEVDQGSDLGHLAGSNSGSVEIYSPLSGVISEINNEVMEMPDLVSSDPYDEGWLCTIEDIDIEECEQLLNPKEYQQMLDNEIE